MAAQLTGLTWLIKKNNTMNTVVTNSSSSSNILIVLKIFEEIHHDCTDCVFV